MYRRLPPSHCSVPAPAAGRGASVRRRFSGSAGVPLSLRDATARALSNNNDIAIERESFHIVDASLLRADAPYDPRSGWIARYKQPHGPGELPLSGAPPANCPLPARATRGRFDRRPPADGRHREPLAGWTRSHEQFPRAPVAEYATYLGIEVRQPLLQNLSIDPPAVGSGSRR